jgi:minimal PKS acyl carrier protein
MDTPLTFEELASLIKTRAGVTIDLAAGPHSTFQDLGVDSLGLLGILGELDNRFGTAVAPGAESSRTPQEFLDAVNHSVKAGA